MIWKIVNLIFKLNNKIYFSDEKKSWRSAINSSQSYQDKIIFDKINNSTGKVYDIGCHKIFKQKVILKNTDWVNKNHWCVPVYYKG